MLRNKKARASLWKIGFQLLSLFQLCVQSTAQDKGFFMLEDDLITTQEQVKRFRLGGGGGQSRMATVSEASRWPNATIWYTVALTYFSEEDLKEMRWAMNQYEKETCLKFREATENSTNFVVVRKGSGGCSSQVGLSNSWGSVQVLNVDEGCRHYGLFLHEFGHTIGLFHEHQHPDRHLQLIVIMKNVGKKMRAWFRPVTQPFLTFDAPYDIQSVMHYGEKAFSNDGNSITMKTKDPKLQRLLTPVAFKDLSFYDVYKINSMYKCAEHCGEVKCPSHSFVNKHCDCVSKEAFAKRRCVDIDEGCEAKRDECEVDKYWMYKRCRKTCNRCYVPL